MGERSDLEAPTLFTLIRQVTRVAYQRHRLAVGALHQHTARTVVRIRVESIIDTGAAVNVGIWEFSPDHLRPWSVLCQRDLEDPLHSIAFDQFRLPVGWLIRWDEEAHNIHWEGVLWEKTGVHQAIQDFILILAPAHHRLHFGHNLVEPHSQFGHKHWINDLFATLQKRSAV